MSTDTEILRALDWTGIACQCPEHECTNTAEHAVRIHALFRCHEAGLSNGNRVELRCTDCVQALHVEVFYRLAEINRWTLPWHCTCGAPLSSVSDVIRSVVRL